MNRIGLITRHLGAALASAATLHQVAPNFYCKNVHAEKKKTYYETLGLSPEATAEQIRKAYKRAAVQTHPDKGGNADEFKEVSRAYEVLSDPDRRRQYDQYGEEPPGFNSNSHESSNFRDPRDIYEHFFGGSSPFSQHSPFQHRSNRTEDLIYGLSCTLEELYHGSKREVKYRRKIACSQCSGSGGDVSTCTNCHGRGVQQTRRQFGNSTMMSQSTCRTCNGGGQVLSNPCTQCSGQGVQEEQEVLKVNLSPGTGEGHQIRFRGRADQGPPGVVSGDVIVQVVLQPHKHFTLLPGGNLLLERSVPFGDALCGIHEDVKHLDGEMLRLVSKEIIQNGDVHKVPGKGMPQSGKRHGDLYVRFTVDKPKVKSDVWDDDTREKIRKKLGGKSTSSSWFSRKEPTEINTISVNASDLPQRKRSQEKESSCTQM